MEDDTNKKFVNSFKSNLLKKIISENVNKLFKKKTEYEILIQQKENEKEKEKSTFLSKTKSFFGNKLKQNNDPTKTFFGNKLKQNNDPTKTFFNNFTNLTSTKNLQKKINNMINSKFNEISKEILEEIIPNENNKDSPIVIKMDKIKELISSKIEIQIRIDEKKEKYLKDIFIPLINEYEKEKK